METNVQNSVETNVQNRMGRSASFRLTDRKFHGMGSSTSQVAKEVEKQADITVHDEPAVQNNDPKVASRQVKQEPIREEEKKGDEWPLSSPRSVDGWSTAVDVRRAVSPRVGMPRTPRISAELPWLPVDPPLLRGSSTPRQPLRAANPFTPQTSPGDTPPIPLTPKGHALSGDVAHSWVAELSRQLEASRACERHLKAEIEQLKSQRRGFATPPATPGHQGR